MKTHIVFDTDDRSGMESTVQIIDHLAEKYLARPTKRYDKSFGKIKFIKTLRSFAKQIQKDFNLDEETYNFQRLKYAKDFTDTIWNDGI